ncbi:MAG: hypothetical protein M1570_17575 [Chloroflexi bacterium]|nr:hypothetical protein [Chloroflexota bacterium]
MQEPQSGTPMQDPQAKLERMYLEEFLRSRGHTLESIKKLPEGEAKRLMTEASTYIGTKLAEVERRASMVHEIHEASQSA